MSEGTNKLKKGCLGVKTLVYFRASLSYSSAVLVSARALLSYSSAVLVSARALIVPACSSLLFAVTIFALDARPAIAQPSRIDIMKARELVNKGNVHLNRREFQQALDCYTESLLLDPKNQTAKDNIVLTHNNWGIWNFHQKKYSEARAEWEQALKLNPLDRSVRRNLQVLKLTMDKLGLKGDEPRPQSAVQTAPPPQPGRDPETPNTSGIVILTPGFKQSQTSGDGASATPSGAGTSSSSTTRDAGTNTTAGGISTYSGNTSSDAKFGESAAPPAQASPRQPVSSQSSSAQPVSSQASPAQPVSSQSSAFATGATPAASSTGGNIETKLDAIEVKIYGRKQDELPLLKRLEKIEIDTHGQVKPGAIQNRIDALRKSYGL